MERNSGPEIKNADRIYATHTETGQMLDISDSRFELSEDVLRLGVYRHYKSTLESLKYYRVEMVLYDTLDDVQLVIYRRLDENESNTPLYARPFEMFTGTVSVDKGKIPRFRFVSL